MLLGIIEAGQTFRGCSSSVAEKAEENSLYLLERHGNKRGNQEEVPTQNVATVIPSTSSPRTTGKTVMCDIQHMETEWEDMLDKTIDRDEWLSWTALCVLHATDQDNSLR